MLGQFPFSWTKTSPWNLSCHHTSYSGQQPQQSPDCAVCGCLDTVMETPVLLLSSPPSHKVKFAGQGFVSHSPSNLQQLTASPHWAESEYTDWSSKGKKQILRGRRQI